MSVYILWLAIVAGAYMAWNIGANDVANAMGTSVGSGALTFRRAVILAGIFEFAGALLVGGHVTQTVRKGIVPPEVFIGSSELFAIGMFSALVGAALWLNIASYMRLPVSTTHSIVGAVFGFGLVAGGFDSVRWATLGKICLSWVTSPVLGGLIAFTTFRVISRLIFYAESPGRASLRLTPYFSFMVGFILALSVIFKGLKNLHLNLPFSTAIVISLGAGALLTFVYLLIFQRKKGITFKNYEDELNSVELNFISMQTATACYIAFAHGSNDVANAVGPLAAVYDVYCTGSIHTEVSVPIWILCLGGVGIIVGLSTWGYRVIETLGKKITAMTPTRGFSATFGAATTVLLCSRLGMPISTTQTLVGAVIGVGLARGIGTLDVRIIRRVISSWAFEIPLTAALTVITYFLIKSFLG
jgi:PiT family inorganic phosphate transporter